MKQHLYEVDLLRAFIILGVLCVHLTSFFNLFAAPMSPSNVTYEGALVALHFTREAFMFITGLVLFITYYRRPFQAVTFWRKRFALIAVPYIAWTLIYILFEGTYLKGFHWTFSYLFHYSADSLLFGKQFYLYYLLISMQLYLLFPLLLWFIRKTEKWHGWVFAASFVVELLLMWWNQAYLQNLWLGHDPTWLQMLIQYRDRYLITYQFWFISGAIVAVHYQRIRDFALKRTGLVFGVWALGLLLLWAHFALQRLVWHNDETMVTLVLQPIMIPYSFLVTVMLWRVGLKWAAIRMVPKWRPFSKFIEIAAAASFGVFLVHPLVLHFVELLVYHLHLTQTERHIAWPIAILVVYLVSIALSRGIANVPILSYIVGQRSSLPKLRAVGVTRSS